MTEVRVGYLPLTDSLPLIVAKENGYFEQENLDVSLQKEVSWANVRDKLVAGVLDAAQMLAPLPAMTTLGVSGVKSPLIYGLVLSRNGNAITLSKQKAAELNAGKLGANEGLTFAVVHTFSSHMLLLRRWLKSQGLDPDRDVNYLIMPPSQMPDALATQLIDGFCVGEPWSSVSVEKNLGEIVALGNEVWPGAAEKVLAVQRDWHEAHTELHSRLRLALMRGADWIAEQIVGESMILAELLSDYLKIEPETLNRSLSGRVKMSAEGNIRCVSDFHLFARQNCGRPNPAEQAQLISACGEVMGKALDPSMCEELSRATARVDLFDEVLALK